MNRFIISGRIANDPDIRYTATQEAIVRFNFAVGRPGPKREGKPDADFFTCAIFGKTAERFEMLNIQKGTKLILEGEIRNNNYTDRDGVKRYENQVNVFSFEFCEKKNTPVEEVAAEPEKDDGDGFQPIPDGMSGDGLPFN